ncbi:MAG: extradiol ring-cleavage dioxygenase [Chloroflexi bacterium]|nr:MAG: extradiol ring-cleavage dioxygenase [Chloroflexota bacterium]
MPLVFAAIAPHGGIAVAESLPPEQIGIATKTRAAMEELGRRFDAARPDATVVLTPHHVHVEGAMAVIVSGTLEGALGEDSHRVALRVPVDRGVAVGIRKALRDAGIPAVGVSFGGNDATQAVAPMDWGTLIPLWFMGGRREAPLPTVVVAPARDLSDDAHVRAGHAIALAAESSGRRVALIASCDHGHAHDPDGPYGFSPRAKEFDAQVVELVSQDRLAALLKVDRAVLDAAKVDSFWQMLMLHGALGDGWHGELLSYEAPTYFGMLCAAYMPR